jgi:phytoene synthase
MTRAASTNFYYAFLTLPPDKRSAIYAVYAFCRLCDDIVDEPERRATAPEELRATRAKLSGAYTGEADGPIWTALSDAQRRFGISESHLADVIAGCEMDLTQNRYATFSDLEQYCRRVAGAVGLVVIEVCGYSDPHAVQHAIDLGIGMQLTNIVRDLAEDARNGRVYLPQDEMLRFEYSEAELFAGEINGQFRALMQYQCVRARRYFASGEKLFPYLDRRTRACPETVYRVYRGLLDRTEAAGYDVFSRRITLSRRTKLALAARLWLRSRFPALR